MVEADPKGSRTGFRGPRLVGRPGVIGLRSSLRTFLGPAHRVVEPVGVERLPRFLLAHWRDDLPQERADLTPSDLFILGQITDLGASSRIPRLIHHATVAASAPSNPTTTKSPTTECVNPPPAGAESPSLGGGAVNPNQLVQNPKKTTTSRTDRPMPNHNQRSSTGIWNRDCPGVRGARGGRAGSRLRSGSGHDVMGEA